MFGKLNRRSESLALWQFLWRRGDLLGALLLERFTGGLVGDPLLRARLGGVALDALWSPSGECSKRKPRRPSLGAQNICLILGLTNYKASCCQICVFR